MTLQLQKFGTGSGGFYLLLIRHTLAWGIFMLYDMTTVYVYTGHWGNIWVHLVYYSINIGLFYTHACWVLPYAFGRSKFPFLSCLLLVLAETAFCLFLKGLTDTFIESFRIPFKNWPGFSRYLLFNAWRGFYFMGFGTAYWLMRRLLVSAREKALSEKDLAEARYAFLQQQISPHFLFNTLNFIYNAVYPLSPAVSESVMQLSDMMRYSLAEPGAPGRVSLRDELEQIRNFAGISRLRYDFQLYILLDIPEVTGELEIIPLVLLTLTENVFKHGDLKDQDRPARIVLSVNGNKGLKFATWNLKKQRSLQKRRKSIGLQNTVKRLDYAYGSRYDLKIKDGPESYELELYLQL